MKILGTNNGLTYYTDGYSGEYDNFWAGIKDKDGNILISPDLHYRQIGIYIDGVAIACQNIPGVVGFQWGLIDAHGNHVSDFKYGFVEECGEGFYRCEIGSKKNILRKDGTEVLKDWCHDVFDVNNGLFICGNTIKKSKTNPRTKYIRGIASVDGTIVHDIIYDRISCLDDSRDIYYGETNQEGKFLLKDGGTIDYDNLSFATDLTLPKEYTVMPFMPDAPEDCVSYWMENQYSKCIIQKTPVAFEKCMPFNDDGAIIDGIHECLADNQGLIEVRHGVTQKYRKYVYSIVKNVSNSQPKGMVYILTMNVLDRNGAYMLQGNFLEYGITGQRETLVFEMCRRNKEVKLDETTGKYKGWFKDPYDANYTRGIPMNLSENRKYDEMFKSHPLSLCRTLIDSILLQN